MHREPSFRWPFRDARRVTADVDAELEFHLREAAAALQREGLDPEAARAEAVRRFGDIEDARRELRTMDMSYERRARRRSWWADVRSDARYGVRVLRRRPGFTALSVGTLALGIGGTAAIFSVVWGLLLRPLPYGHEGSIVAFWRPMQWSAAEFEVARESATEFTELAAWSWDGRTLRQDGAPARLVEGIITTGGLFPVLQAPPRLGRTLRPEDSRVGAEPVVVLSHRLWREDFGGDPRVVGRTVLMDGQPRTVVGVMPSEFYFPTPAATYWIPLAIDPAEGSYGGNHWLELVGRVAPDASPADPGLLAPIVAMLDDRFNYAPQWDKTRDASVEPIRRSLLGEQRSAILLLAGILGLILLIACANVAALLLGRAADRRAELAVRAAMGASRGRLARQMITESAVLGLLGGLTGAALAAAGFRALIALLPLDPALVERLQVDWPLLFGALGLALLSGVAVGLAPVARVLRGRLREALGARRGSGGGVTRGRLQAGLVVLQVMVAVLLVAAASVLARSLIRMQAVDVGLQPEDVLVVDIFAGSGELDTAELRRFLYGVTERLAALPGVTVAAAINRLPVRDGGFTSGARPIGRDLPGPEPRVWWRPVTPDYHRTMGIRRLRGRGIAASDDERAPPVAVVNESFAFALWPGEDPIGRRYRAGMEDVEITVVGVVEDVRITGVREPPVPVAYRPYAQVSWITSAGVLVLRDQGDVAALAEAARRTVQDLNPAVAVPRVTTMRRVLAESMSDASRMATFATLFAILALLLGAIGVYGVVSYAVVRRRHEFGIRLALGSSPRRVLGEVLRGGLGLTAAGLTLGFAALALSAGILRRFVYATAPLDPVSLAVTALVLVGTAALACWLPARRAAGVDPARALRGE